MTVPVRALTFWLNAFLPWSIPGVTTTLRQGPYRGHSALAGPRYCLTDQRGFSSDRRAASRMHSKVTIDLTKEVPTLTQEHRCDYTTECDHKTGQVQLRKKAETARMNFALRTSESQIVIHVEGIASNPGTSTTWAFGEIAYKGTIMFEPLTGGFAGDLLISLFPAFEAYASINEEEGIVVFRHMPAPGLRASQLSPGAHRPIHFHLTV
jgi:hypothetical protein